MSADPLAVHVAGEADLNVYAYVSGAVLKNVDPLGLEPLATTDASAGGASSQSGGTEGTSGTQPHGTTAPSIQSAGLGFDPSDAQSAYAHGQTMGYGAAATPGGAFVVDAAARDFRDKLSPEAYQAWASGVAEAAGIVALSAAATAEATGGGALILAPETGGSSLLVGTGALCVEAGVAVNAASVLAVAIRAQANGPSVTPQDRGRANEGRVLSEMGETKNTTKHSTSEGDTIPDFENERQVGDIKDTKTLSNTKQMKAQRELAEKTGREHVVVTGDHTKVSKPMEQSGTTIVRRSDIGPQAPVAKKKQ